MLRSHLSMELMTFIHKQFITRTLRAGRCADSLSTLHTATFLKSFPQLSLRIFVQLRHDYWLEEMWLKYCDKTCFVYDVSRCVSFFNTFRFHQIDTHSNGQASVT